MEIIKFLEELNALLDKSFIFRGYKFLLAFYLTVIFLAVAAILYRIGRLYWTVLVSGQGSLHIRKGEYFRRWKKVEKLLEKDDSASQKAAVLEASQIFNEVLDRVGYKKPKLGDKLADMTEVQLVNLEEARWANKLKNEIVKNPQFVLNKREAERAVAAFEAELDFFEAI